MRDERTRQTETNSKSTKQPLGSREEHQICRAAVMRAEAAAPAGGHTREPAHEQPCARRPTAFDCKQGLHAENLPCLGLGLVRWNRAKSVVLGPQPLSGQKFFACGALNKEGELAALANSLPHPERGPPSGAYCRCLPTVAMIGPCCQEKYMQLRNPRPRATLLIAECYTRSNPEIACVPVLG